ncbi:MAG: hypothetical protein J6Q84_03775, partial [Kiritimatiellae bacterium]|nr:hypothetical protein [Kiritimatiellia bacterium]
LTGWSGDVTAPVINDVTFVAEYAAIPYGISYAELKGAVNPNPATYTIEDEVVFAPLSDVEGWNFVGWSPKSIAKGSTGPITVTAQWERVFHSVNVGGVSTNVVYGSQMTFCAPEPWYDETCTTQIVYVGTTFTAPIVTNEFTVAVTNNIDFTWDILATNYWLEVEATELGSITGAMSGWQSAGEVVELAAVPEDGCRLYRWMGDIEGCVATNELLFVEMNRTRAIGARFAYDIRAVIDSISPQNPTEESSLILQGHGEGGTVAEHLWTVVRLSDGKVSELARTENCRVKLNAGEWRVEYRVKDITGIWSDPASQTITVAAMLPVVDLQVARSGVKFYDSIGLPTANVEVGDVVTVKVTVQNRGNAGMSGRGSVYLCDGILPVDDISGLTEKDSRILASARLSRLSLGGSQSVSMIWNVGKTFSGLERVYEDGPNAFTVVVVPDDDVESVVNNNLVTTMLELGECDIQLSEIFNISAEYETSMFVGSDYSVSGKVWYERDGARVYVAGAALTFMIDGEIAGSGITDSSGRYLWMFTAPEEGDHTILIKAVDGTVLKTYEGSFTSVNRADSGAGEPGEGGGSGGDEDPTDPEEPVPTVKKANLNIQSFVCTGSGIIDKSGNFYSASLGGEAKLEAVVRNVGLAAVTNAFTVKIVDNINGDFLGYAVATNGLNVGEEMVVALDEPIVLEKAGRFGYSVIVDEEGCIDESSEMDNESKVWVTVEEPLPNLVVTDMTLSDAQPVEGDELIINATVRNIGSASCPAGVRVDLDANGIRYEIKVSEELAAGESADVAYSVFPVSGSLRILIEADYFDEIAESIETDNSLSRTITVYSANADVAPVSLTADPYPSAGEPCVLTAVFKNNGGASYQGGTAVFFANDPESGTIAESMVGPISWKGGTGMATCVWTPVGNENRTVGVILEGKVYKTVFSAMPPPDLRVMMEDISFEPGTPSSGDNVKFRAMIRNVSGSVASTNATVVFDVAPVDGDFSHLTTMTVSYLAPGGSVAVDADIPYTVLRGIYKVKVSVMDESGRDVRSSDNIAERIFGVDVPVAVTGGDIVCVAGDTVTLDGSDSIDATQWRWSLIEAPNGNTASISDASVAVTTFTPQIAGLYKFSLVVSDGLNESTPAECTVLVDRVRITASATKGGSISPSGEIVYPAGATPEYVGIEARGYSFDSFKLDGVSVANKPSTYMFTALDRNHIIEACFSAVDYSITYNELKSAENTNPVTYTVEDEVVFAPLSDVEGWNFVGWSPKSIAKGSTGAITVTAQWERVFHSVNVGGVSTNVVYGSEMTFRAPEPWYDETCTTQIVYVGTTFTAPVVTNEFTVVVTNDIDFAWDILNTNYWFDVAEVHNGTIDAPENGWKPHGDSFVISAIPDEHYHFVSWLGDTQGCIETNITDLVVTMDQARKISATFAIDTFIVKFDPGAHGVLSGETTQKIAYGATAVVPSVIPDVGYSLTGWSGDVTAPVINDVTFVAEYAAIPYGISYAELKGAVNTNPATYTIEDEVVFAPLSNVEGWNFVGWSPESIAKGSTGQITVTAQWERVIHSVNVGGVSTNVVYGSEMTFRAPEPWYDETCTTQIVYVGTTFTAPVVTNEFTVVITNDIDFTWDILATNYWLKVSASEGGSVDFDDAWMSAGSRKSISATPDFSYRFVHWEGDVSDSQSTSPDIVVLMNQARSLKAVFEKIPLTIGEAANAPEYDWYTEGDAMWFGEWSKAASDGVHAVRSGAIGDSKETVLGLRLDGAGTLSFDWRASCEERYDAVRLEVDGKQIRVLWGETSWTNVCISLDVGEHDIRWVYKKGRSGALGEDAVWVDNVVWESATEPTLAEALGEFEWETEGDINWVGMRSEYAYEGTSFAIAEGLGDFEASIIRTRVSGAGTIKFRWAVSCEEFYDWFDFVVDGEVVEMTTGETDWMEVSVELGEGDHVLEWMYWKDEMDDPDLVGANCAMLDYVRWYPLDETPPEISDKTLAAFFAWLKANNQISQNATKEDAIRVFSSGMTAVGKSATLYSEFVAGTNPADVTSEFKAMIEIDENDQPIVTPSPNLGSSRKYVVFGKKNLEDSTEDWKEVEKGKEKDYNFFKINVDLSE